MLDNGPEFAGTALDAWAAQHGVHLHLIQPEKPVQNAFIASFNGKFRDECLNGHWFVTLQEAQRGGRNTMKNGRTARLKMRHHPTNSLLTIKPEPNRQRRPLLSFE
jgi:putative transposase